jgi:WD40 repeat protein
LPSSRLLVIVVMRKLSRRDWLSTASRLGGAGLLLTAACRNDRKTDGAHGSVGNPVQSTSPGGELLCLRAKGFDFVVCAAFSPNGRYVLAGGASLKNADGKLFCWDLNTARIAREFKGHTQNVRAVAFSPDGTRILSGSQDETVRFWDWETGKELRRYPAPTLAGVRTLAFAPDGGRFLADDGDKAIEIWDVEKDVPVSRFQGHEKDAWCAAFLPDGRRVISSGGGLVSLDRNEQVDCNLRVWEAETGHEICRLEGHSGAVYCVVCSRDGKYALSGSADHTVRLWDIDAAKEIRRFVGHTEEVHSVALSPDGRRAVSGSGSRKLENEKIVPLDCTLRLWDVESGKELRRFSGHDDWVINVAISPDGRRALSAGRSDGTVRLWDVAG